MITMPVWVWGIIAGTVVVLMGIVGWFVANLIRQYKEEMKNISEKTETIKNFPCAAHNESFMRVHSEREKTETSLEIGICELNKNVSVLSTSVQVLGVKLDNIKDKHDENRIFIDRLDHRITVLEHA